MAVTRELMLEQLERATSWKNPTAWDVLWGLLVVAGSPPQISFSCAPERRIAPHPPGPGLPLQAPSV